MAPGMAFRKQIPIGHWILPSNRNACSCPSPQLLEHVPSACHSPLPGGWGRRALQAREGSACVHPPLCAETTGLPGSPCLMWRGRHALSPYQIDCLGSRGLCALDYLGACGTARKGYCQPRRYQKWIFRHLQRAGPSPPLPPHH